MVEQSSNSSKSQIPEIIIDIGGSNFNYTKQCFINNYFIWGVKNAHYFTFYRYISIDTYFTLVSMHEEVKTMYFYTNIMQDSRIFGVFQLKLPGRCNFGRSTHTIGTSGRRCSRSPFRRTTGNDVSGHYFRRYFLLLFPIFFHSPSQPFLIERVLRSKNSFSKSGSNGQ